MKQITTHLFILCIMVNFHTFAQTSKLNQMDNSSYTDLWKQIETMESKSLPRSANEIAEKIYSKALMEKNSPQLIKALIHQMKYQIAMDKNRLPELILSVELLAENNQNETEQCILYSFLAQLYDRYYSINAYTINQRTAVTGTVPDDIREWTGNIFIKKICEAVERSLYAEKMLQSTYSTDYAAILQEGESSRILRPTLFDFIAAQGIETLSNLINSNLNHYFHQSKFSQTDYFSPVSHFILLPIHAEPCDIVPQIARLYQRLLSFRMQENQPEALLMVDLDRLDFINRHTENDDRSILYLAALNELEKIYESNDYCVEILYKKAQFYRLSMPMNIMPRWEFATDQSIQNEKKACHPRP